MALGGPPASVPRRRSSPAPGKLKNVSRHSEIPNNRPDRDGVVLLLLVCWQWLLWLNHDRRNNGVAAAAVTAFLLLEGVLEAPLYPKTCLDRDDDDKLERASTTLVRLRKTLRLVVQPVVAGLGKNDDTTTPWAGECNHPAAQQRKPTSHTEVVDRIVRSPWLLMLQYFSS